MARALLGAPLRAVWCHGTREHRFDVAQSSTSLITMNCNTLWCTALNMRASHELQWFAMLHSDVEPVEWWIDKLIAEAEKYGADMMSAVIPLKNFTGSTSTGIANAGKAFNQFCRLTQSQVRHPSFPETFGINEAVDALAALPEPLRVVGRHASSFWSTRVASSFASRDPGLKRYGSSKQTASR